MFPPHDDLHKHRHNIPTFDCLQVYVYKRSERIRTRLRLVCRSWDVFLEEYSDRFVHLNQWAPNGYWPPIKRWDHVVRLQGPVGHKCYCGSDEKEPCWPVDRGDSPTLSQQSNTGDVEPLLLLLSNRCKEIILPGFWRDKHFDLGKMNSVTVVQEKANTVEESSHQSRQITGAYRHLTHLSMRFPFLQNPTFHLDLPSLISLKLEIFSTGNSSQSRPPNSSGIGHWVLPSLRYLHVLSECIEEDDVNALHQFLKHLGKSIVELEISMKYTRVLGTGLLTCDWWDWLPQLRLFKTCLDIALCMNMPSQNVGCEIVLDGVSFVGWQSRDYSMDDIRARWKSGRSWLGRISIDISWHILKKLVESSNRHFAGSIDESVLEVLDILHGSTSGLEDEGGNVFSPTIVSELCQ